MTVTTLRLGRMSEYPIRSLSEGPAEQSGFTPARYARPNLAAVDCHDHRPVREAVPARFQIE